MPRFTSGAGDDFKVVKLPEPIQSFIDNPPPEGGRNAALLQAAIQARDLKWLQSQTEAALLPPALSCGLKEPEILATIRSAYTREPREPAGRIGGDVPHRTYKPSHVAPPAPKQKATEYAFDPDFKLPAPIESAPIAYLEALYRPGEKLAFMPGVFDLDKGKETPDKYSTFTMERDVLLKVLREKTGGSLSKIHGFDVNRGLYINLNPINKTSRRRRKEDIADYRYALLEFDTEKVSRAEIPLEKQLQIILQSRVPVVAVCTSGHHSIHAIIPVNAGKNEELFKSRVSVLLEHFGAYEMDDNNKDITRLSRFPGVNRCDFHKGEQQLLMLKTGFETWEEWEREIMVENDGLPAIEDMFDLLAEFRAGKMEKPAEVIQGVAHVGCKLVFGGASKAKKTWALADLAASVMSGGKWFNHLPCNKGNVLYLNMELPKYFMVERIDWILRAKGIDITDRGQFKMINLRGFSANLIELRPKLERAIEGIQFSLILLDPTYKLMPGGDENGTQDSSLLLNEIERLAVKSGALCAFGSHFSKGNQAAKKAMDRISGSGVFARDPDTIITMTEHDNTDALTVDFNLRNHKPFPAFVAKWDAPLFKIDVDLDPAKLAEDDKKTTKKAAAETFMVPPGKKAKIKEYLAANPAASQRDFGAFLMPVFDCGKDKARATVIPKLIEMGLIEEFSGAKEGKKPTFNYRFLDKKSEPEPDETDEPF